MPERSFDAVVVGAGIVGLAHAYHLARRGLRVLVCERHRQAQGASIRNFGMLWPIGQPAGRRYHLAHRSRELWLELLRSSGIWHETCGSLHLAYRELEAQVLTEFAASATDSGIRIDLLSPDQAARYSPAVNTEGLRAALWSPTEICVDPREVVARLPGWLAETYGVQVEFGCAVTDCSEAGRIRAGEREWRAKRVYVCSGDDLETLFPEWFRESGLFRCKLQMMRTAPFGDGFRLGPMLAGGLTLRHYEAFRNCPSLEALKRQVAEEAPEFDRYGIHVMASQNGRGEIVLGDSHEYGGDIEPFDKTNIENLILGYLDTFLKTPGLRIAARWNGTYVKHPTEPFYLSHPSPATTLVTGLGGAGMTLSFGLAEEVVNETLGESE